MRGRGSGGVRAAKRGCVRHTAFSPISSVRIRTRCSTGSTKTFPSPILPVLTPRSHDDADRFIDHLIGEHDFDFHFRKKINRVFAAAINFGVALLSSEAFHFRDRHPFDAELGQGFLQLPRGLNGLMMASRAFSWGPKLAAQVGFSSRRPETAETLRFSKSVSGNRRTCSVSNEPENMQHRIFSALRFVVACSRSLACHAGKSPRRRRGPLRR